MELENVKKAVCLIQSTAEGNRVLYKGTGFHFGRGWIMTVAHNFQDDQERKKKDHNIMSEGKFKVTWNGCEFEEHKRMAFIHQLKPGEHADFQNKDIAMFKLGTQYEYGGRNNDRSDCNWEKREDKKLEKMNASSCAIADVQFDPPNPQVGDDVYAFHYGGDSSTSPVEQQTKITQIIPGSDTVPLLVLKKGRGVLPHGSSGCPVMIKRDGKYYLAGLHFSGDGDEKSGKAQALPWNSGIQGYINKGVGIIANIGSYMAYRELQDAACVEAAKKSESELISDAKKANLTIYLCNGDVLK